MTLFSTIAMLKFSLQTETLTERITMSMYESDITQFVRELLDKNPALKELQRTNRATWWERAVDVDEIEGQAASEAPKQPYAYFPLPTPQTKTGT